MDTPTPAPLARLLDAVRDRDPVAIEACFRSDYRNETPAHPSRGFTGGDQVRRNWERILGAVPDLQARVERWAADGDTVWTEWSQRGTRRDGAAFEMRGVIVFELAGDKIAAARFFLEPVERGGDGIDDAVITHVGDRP
jgi:ketosteroid isomerase-like protein